MNQCNRTICRMNHDFNTDPAYVLGASLFSGFLFATWSWGILYLLLFLVLYEICYYIYCHSYGTLDSYSVQIRIGVFAGAIMGFLIGRAITETDDHEDSIKEFCQRMRKFSPF